ncbi:hypothetical protein [Actinomadura rupiterrae]|uniref:hypothetical protein n=1 Tax=Actinomadura rupiterrae TaxID=559627 RepID=UPI0020A32CD4|nr:hypothetical protein [Actinomadura rupiterrae]MCP2335267.1 hypothetical protein [Actinomadura rupiterrae]
MRRAVGAAIAGLAVAGAAALVTAPWRKHESGPVDAAQAASHLKVSADPAVRPVGGDRLVPGGRFSYGFTVTNAGKRPVRGLVARSEKVVGGRAGTGLSVESVSDPSCARTDRVICSFPALATGERRSVKVVGVASAERHRGDLLQINTYLAAVSPGVNGQLSFEVLGRAVPTVTAFS